MNAKRQNPIPERKLKLVDELSELIKNNRTIMIASIKNIPASQYQEIGKKLRGKAIIKVPKKNLIFRAIDSADNETVQKLKEQITESVALLFSDLDAFELAGELSKNKSPAKAKAGQEAPEDIEVQAGPTELMPGPAISELGAVGIQVQIEKGKISIKASKVIAKEGEKISSAAADIMAKLDIKPFSIGFEPLSAFDTQENKLYLELKIDRAGAIEDLKKAHGKALPFAVEIGYSTPDTIKFLLSKAHSHGKALEGLIPQKEPAEEKKEEAEPEKAKTEETPVEETKAEEDNTPKEETMEEVK